MSTARKSTGSIVAAVLTIIAHIKYAGEAHKKFNTSMLS